jgi:mRNA interferase MazF
MASKKIISINSKITPKQGEVWYYDPHPIIGREIGKKLRPALIVSSNDFNFGLSGLVIVIPMTSKGKGIDCHVRMDPPNGGISKTSFILCDQIRSISKDRLKNKIGKLNDNSLLYTVLEWVQDLLRVENNS